MAGISCVVAHADRALDSVAAGEAGAVVAQQAVAVGKGGLVHERLGPSRRHAPMDQHDGLSGSPQLVFQLDAVDRRSLHLIGDDLGVSRGLHGSPLG
jgi:hypothetical protein